MAVQDRNTLKNYFETGNQPTEDQLASLIDSMLALEGSSTNISNIASLDATKILLLIDPIDSNLYKTTIANILSLAQTKNKTWLIKDTPSGNPVDMQQQSGNSLNNTSIHNVTPLDVMIRNNVPLQWKAAGITYNHSSGFDFTAIGGLQDGDVITVAFI